MAGDVAQEVAALRADLAAYGRGLELLASAVNTANEKLDLVLEAVTTEPGPSPLQRGVGAYRGQPSPRPCV
jgi:hypothetical protein